MKIIKLRLDQLLRERNITRYELAKITNTQYQVIDKYYKNKVVRYDSYILLRICTALNCGIEQLIEIKDENA